MNGVIQNWGDKNNFTSVITTSHCPEGEYGGVGILKDSKFKDMPFIGNDHSHPDRENPSTDWQPSGSHLSPNDIDRKKSEDIGYANFVENKNPNAVLRVYYQVTKTFFTYNSKTYVPAILDDPTVVGHKKKN